ncbi:hypothetical protein RvY_06822 [Ramazzottius varieornatus]|uniref:LITAF domain-containing protein n=1 Tax=Ramazzottius varieornatus TaxID=947166 RepID=A0A1D1V651_RAMVA|nr:hypothetical protein RvY_06822 [Ramazzottius varieornatus]
MEKADPATLNVSDLPPGYPGQPNTQPAFGGPPPPSFVHQGSTGIGYPSGPVILTTIGGFPLPNCTPDPCQIQCPSCNNNVLTQTEYEAGAMTWLWAGGLCLLGCWLGCCLVPFCINETQDVIHKCPNCNSVVGRYRRLH